MENSSQTDTPLEERCYNRAMACFKEREYEVAYRLFQLLGDYKDARQKSEEAKQTFYKQSDNRNSKILVCVLIVLAVIIFLVTCGPALLFVLFGGWSDGA